MKKSISSKAKKLKIPTKGKKPKLKKQAKASQKKPASFQPKSQVPDSGSKVSLVDLLEAGSHFGHQVRRWNPKMKPYIWKEQGGVHLFDLAITAQKIKETIALVQDLVKEGQAIVFVGTKRQAKDVVKAEAIRCQMPYVISRWPGGLLTNWDQINKSISDLTAMKKGKAEGMYNKYTKKENILIDRKIVRLERLFGGLTALSERPSTLFIVDTVREKTAVLEARAKGAMVIAIADTNSDPDLIDHLIPANDDALRSIKLILSKVAEAVILGMAQRKAREDKPKI